MNDAHETIADGTRGAEDVQGFFTPVPIPSARLTTLGTSTRLAGANLLPRTTLASEAGPANNPRPTSIGG